MLDSTKQKYPQDIKIPTICGRAHVGIWENQNCAFPSTRLPRAAWSSSTSLFWVQRDSPAEETYGLGRHCCFRNPVSLSTTHPTSQLAESQHSHPLCPAALCPHLSTRPCPLQMDDAGRYQCVATNEMGAVTKAVTLVLQSEFQLCP